MPSLNMALLGSIPPNSIRDWWTGIRPVPVAGLRYGLQQLVLSIFLLQSLRSIARLGVLFSIRREAPSEDDQKADRESHLPRFILPPDKVSDGLIIGRISTQPTSKWGETFGAGESGILHFRHV